MFLHLIKDEDKINFLELANYAMNVDGSVDKLETAAFDSFKTECQMNDYICRNKSVDEILDFFSLKSTFVKKIVFIEITGIILSNNEMAEAEHDLLQRMSEKLDIDKIDMKRMIRWVQTLNDVINEGFEFINK